MATWKRGSLKLILLRSTITIPPANCHGYLDPECGVGFIDEDGRVSIWSCGQAPHYHRDEVARVLGLGTDEVRVVEDGTGGGFGARIDPFIQLLIGLAVYKAKVPVKTSIYH
jgi:Aerobic-type carbon monoxide dehydrogenase, large subunit CoxL/CutL homologs